MHAKHTPYDKSFSHPEDLMRLYEDIGRRPQLTEAGAIHLAVFQDSASTHYEMIVDDLAKTIRLVAESHPEDMFSMVILAWLTIEHPLITKDVVLDACEATGMKDSRDSLSEVFDSALQNLNSAIYENEINRLRTMPYQDYLKTDHWQTIRHFALEAAGYRCRLCNAESELHVHHRTYERRGKELPDDVIALCKTCHEIFHEHTDVVKTKRDKTPTRWGPRKNSPDPPAPTSPLPNFQKGDRVRHKKFGDGEVLSVLDRRNGDKEVTVEFPNNPISGGRMKTLLASLAQLEVIEGGAA